VASSATISRGGRRALVLKVVAPALAVLTADGCNGEPPPTQSKAALGDSTSRALGACGRSGDCVGTSWATGAPKDLDSHAQRLATCIANTDRCNHNLAVSGARVAGLALQVEAAV
jgi:hypothetical protein